MKTMKTKTYYFTKIITFCVLSLFLITNMILFTSCDNGNSPNDNTNEEQNNNAPTDYCKICDGVQDKNHQHDYCGKCEGTQTTPHTCPVELKAEIESIGNGTYTIANFMVDPGTTKVDEMVAAWLPNAERHIKNALDSFTPEFQAKYSEELALITDKNAFNQNTTSGFDSTINRLNDSCAPIFEEIIEKIDTPLDRARFIRYYQALSNEAYKHGSGNYFYGNYKQEDTYNSEKKFSYHGLGRYSL